VHAAGPSKCPRTANADGDEDDDEYKRQTRLDYEALPWNQRLQGEEGNQLSLSLQKTQSLLTNFTQDLKQAKSSLLNCGKSYPQFPDSEWGNLLGGKAINLDHVLLGMYSVSHDEKGVQPISKGTEILHGSSKPAETVKTHGEWVIAWNALVDTTLFVFDHRDQELKEYRSHIMHYFASTTTKQHDHIINYDKAVWIRVAQRRDLELTYYHEFSDLQLQWIQNPTVV
jgi:hypothetical protein